MKTQSYAEFSSELRQKTQGNRSPLTGSIDLTYRCSVACLHCLNNLGLNDSNARARELSKEDHHRILDELCEAGCLWLLLTGGEVLAREDFAEIYLYAKHKGFLVTVFTNATLITPEIADLFAEWPPYKIEVSIYGMRPETHDAITRSPGSHAKCVRGVKLLLERNLTLQLKTMALRQNRAEIGAMKRFAKDELGVRFRFDAMVNCRIDCGRAPLASRLSPVEAVELDLADPDRVDAWRKFAERFGGPVHDADETDGLYQCGAGVFGFAIDPYGILRGCGLASGEGYDLRNGTFREGWEVALLKERKRAVTKRTKCTECAIKAMCGMCPPNAALECGDEEAPIEFFCETAHLRAYAFGIEVPAHGDCEFCRGGARFHKTTDTARALQDRSKAASECPLSTR